STVALHELFQFFGAERRVTRNGRKAAHLGVVTERQHECLEVYRPAIGMDATNELAGQPAVRVGACIELRLSITAIGEIHRVALVVVEDDLELLVGVELFETGKQFGFRLRDRVVVVHASRDVDQVDELATSHFMPEETCLSATTASSASSAAAAA